MSSKYRTYFKKITSLSGKEVKMIIDLYLVYYEGVHPSVVESDLKEKSEILLLFYSGLLVGFSTCELYKRMWKAKQVTIIYSGDTIVRHEHWGQQALAFAWIRYIGQLKQKEPDCSMYWFLIVKGHRTFKYLPTFTKSFYPHWSIDRSDLKPLLDCLANEKFGKCE